MDVLKKSIQVMIFLAGALSAPLVFANGWAGNGGNNSLDKDNIWFMGEAPIPYCIVSSVRSPSKAALDYIVKSSARKWAEFFDKYEISKNPLEEFPDQISRAISTQLIPADNCEQIRVTCVGQAYDQDQCYKLLQDKLLILFGEPNPVVNDYLKFNGQAAGAAIRTIYNHKTYRSGGIVWVRPEVQSSWDQLSHMLLHEMGHVFGMKHDSCWVMASNVARLLNSTLFSFGALGSIEAPNWPYSFIKEQKLFFTDQRISFGESPKGYYPNRVFLSESILNALSFDPKGSFQVSGKILDTTWSGVDIEITILEYPSGKTHALAGSLNQVGIGDDSLQPSLYTEWFNSSYGQKYFSTHKIRSGWVSENLRGVLDFNGQKVAVTLDRKKGMVLSLYFPNTDRFLTLETAQIRDQNLK